MPDSLPPTGDLLLAARTYLERALGIDEASFGPEHPSVAISLSNLGMVLKDLGDLAQARKLLQRSYKIFKATLGDEHPNTKTVYGNLRAVEGI